MLLFSTLYSALELLFWRQLIWKLNKEPLANQRRSIKDSTPYSVPPFLLTLNLGWFE